MEVTNEQVGKWLLLGIILSDLVKLIMLLACKINRKFSLRKDGWLQFYTITTYTTLWLTVWGFSPISNWYKEKIVSFLFNNTIKDGELSVLVLILLCFLFVPIYKHIAQLVRDNYLISARYLSPLITILCLYLYHRFFSNDYTFVSISQKELLNNIKLLDLPAILLIVYLIILLFYCLFEQRSKPIYRSNLLVDGPLTDMGEDEYDRGKYYDSLIKTISTSFGNKGRALSIGLVNRWGEGKTSFIKFLKKEFLSDSNTLFIEFNAWNSSNGNNLTLDFFQTLDHELSMYIDTGTVLRKYAKNLSNIDNPFNPFRYVPDNWIRDKSNKEYFDDINSMLDKLGKRIIVAIDDLDRLDGKEMFSVFQVIRNSANFDNAVFLTPFDKEYVICSLTEMKIHNPIDYIKKIFDAEISLPPISKYHRIKTFETCFSEALKKLNDLDIDSDKWIRHQINDILIKSGRTAFDTVKYSSVGQTMFEIIKNKRDVTRFVNSLVVTLRDSHGIVYLLDVFIFELIKYLDINLFRKLFESEDWYDVSTGSNNFLKIKVINAEVHQRMLDSIDNPNLRTIIDRLLRDLLAMPLSNDFNASNSFHYASKFDNYHQFNEAGIDENDMDNLFN